jgi:hypothetical protein
MRNVLRYTKQHAVFPPARNLLTTYQMRQAIRDDEASLPNLSNLDRKDLERCEASNINNPPSHVSSIEGSSDDESSTSSAPKQKADDGSEERSKLTPSECEHFLPSSETT